MGYNNTFFQPDLNTAQNEKLQKQLDMQKLVLELLIENLLAANHQVQLQGCDSFLYIISKIRFNVEAVNQLFPLLFSDFRYKTGINLIFRSIVDDIINFTYLLGFVELNNPLQISLENELSIFHKEYLQASIEGLEAEFEFQDLVNHYQQTAAEPRPPYMDEIIADNPGLFDEAGEWKGNLDIRATTRPEFKPLMNQTDNRKRSFISEAQKLTFIKNRNFETHAQLKALFKYFSQYQHYSPKTIALMNHHMEYDIMTYQHVLGNVLISVNRLYDFMKFDDLDKLKKEWDRVSEIVFNSFKA